MTSNPNIAKWGFGMAPISRRMRVRYDLAVQAMLDLLGGHLMGIEYSPEHVSELKGMFNRCIRQDQWDWFTVYTEFGEPSQELMRAIVADLKPLRKAIIENHPESVETRLIALGRNNIVQFLTNYQNGITSYSPESGWVYMLSTREQPDILKIGMTNRTVFERVKEINSATGVLLPYSARKVFRVKNASHAERMIHGLLADYRIRPDREFFSIPFGDAVRIIERFIETERLESLAVGELVWFDLSKKYGFIRHNGDDVFLHKSQMETTHVADLSPGTALEFELGQQQQGLFALNARIADLAR